MTKPRQIAKTLKSILDNSILQSIMNRKEKISPIADFILEQWKYDLQTRTAGVAYNISLDGELVEYTTLDLATFLFSLKDRNAVINLPDYKAKRPQSIKENEIILSNKNRHGHVIGVTSNQNVFTFGMRIRDLNIMNTKPGEVGGFRTFLITDFDGKFYDGWNSIQFVPDAKENKWLFDNDVWSPDRDDDKITFKYFVNPNRWVSFYGQHYFLLKVLECRLSEQIKYMRKIIKDMLDSGVQYPWSADHESVSHDYERHTEVGDSIKVWSFQAEIDLPEDKSVYPEVVFNQINLVVMTRIYKKLEKDLQATRFNIRTVEFAFAKKHPPEEEGNFHIFPNWIKDTTWEDYKIKKTVWKRLKIVQPEPFERSIAIRYRWYQKSEKIRQG